MKLELRILRLLFDGTYSIKSLIRFLGYSQPAICAALNKLIRLGYVTKRPAKHGLKRRYIYGLET